MASKASALSRDEFGQSVAPLADAGDHGAEGRRVDAIGLAGVDLVRARVVDDLLQEVDGGDAVPGKEADGGGVVAEAHVGVLGVGADDREVGEPVFVEDLAVEHLVLTEAAGTVGGGDEEGVLGGVKAGAAGAGEDVADDDQAGHTLASEHDFGADGGGLVCGGGDHFAADAEGVHGGGDGVGVVAHVGDEVGALEQIILGRHGALQLHCVLRIPCSVFLVFGGRWSVSGRGRCVRCLAPSTEHRLRRDARGAGGVQAFDKGLAAGDDDRHRPCARPAPVRGVACRPKCGGSSR